MGKSINILLALLLLISTIGVTVHKHYCENVLIATSILPQGDEDACDMDMPMDNNSCSDEHDHYKVDAPIVILALNFEMTPSFDWVTASFFTVNTSQFENILTPKFYADLNPPPAEPNIYTKIQSFLL